MGKDDRLPFGRYHWRVLAVADKRMLMITEDATALRWYHTTVADGQVDVCGYGVHGRRGIAEGFGPHCGCSTVKRPAIYFYVYYIKFPSLQITVPLQYPVPCTIRSTDRIVQWDEMLLCI
jgi:hypothetical protein